ncbi:MAG: efflux RND transporter periplasmic adaptor subunit [Xanthomonadales bacterium]|nr:efflux RND transporter periplasmic adaptor subunit [Xanthomonadales bacterium]
MTRKQTYVVAMLLAIGLLAIGLFAGNWWARHDAAHGKGRGADSGSTADTRKALYWFDPMVPDQHFDKPGKSPFMDMQLVPKYADEVTSSGVRIASGVQQNVGIRTAPVETGTLASEIRVPGTLTWDLRQEFVVSARVEGIVTRVEVKAPFEPVRRGQTLATLLAPEWSTALAEAQALSDARSASARELRSAAQQRLRVLGVSGRSGSGGVALTAPSDGVVSEVLIREGQTVMAGTPLFRINGTATLWLEAAIPQAGVAGIRPGTPVEAMIDALPGQTFTGEVEALLPQIDSISRTQRARVVLRNPQGQLVPGMFAELRLRPEGGQAVPLVPNEALIATGTDSRVIVVGTDGAFQPVHVRTGRSSGGKTEILAGLQGGERVVVSGQFLIDSEASLSGALQRLQAPEAPAPITKPMQDMETSSKAISTASKPTMPKTTVHKPNAGKPSDRARRSCTVAYWYDPMVPDQHFEQPGKSPFMDMQLVPKFDSGADSNCTVRDVEAAATAEPRP